MKILVWATTFGADLWSLTRHLAARQQAGEDLDVRVVTANAGGWAQEGVAKLFPLGIPVMERRPWHHLVGIPGFHPDITVLDNRVPLRSSSKKGFVLWHGFGWKGPNDREEFKVLHSRLRHAFGDPLSPNPDFNWSCFGPTDFQHRSRISGFAPENCRIVGAASHDDLRQPFDKALAQPFYPFDIVRRRTVLIAPTWHYGELFAHWGRDADLVEQLLAHLERRGVNVILRMHDRFRFEAPYLAFLDDLARRHPNLLLKFKDRHPDNFLDLQVADVLISNYSSIACLYYATRRPALHIYPVRDADEEFLWRTHTLLGQRKRKVANARFVWTMSPDEHGGLQARDFAALIAGIDRALDEPDCCHAAARAFLDRHMLGADGGNCERIVRELRALAAA